MTSAIFIFLQSSVFDVPAMFPRAHTACSQTAMFVELSRRMKAGTAPALTTIFVWSLVPEAMLVSAQAASN